MEKLKGVIDRIEGKIAVISSNGYKIEIPRDILPKGSSEGDVIFLTLTNEEEETNNQNELAKSVLNEVLGEE